MRQARFFAVLMVVALVSGILLTHERLSAKLPPSPHSSREASMGKPVIHFEIGGRDKQRAMEFYTKLFDWTSEPYGPLAYKLNTGSDKGINGQVTALGHEPQNYVMVYVEVEDVKASADKAVALGGKVVVPPMNLPGGGQFAWLSDPDGNLLGLLKALK